MSVWELIGWTIFIPMALLTALFAYALVVALVRVSAKTKRQSETASKERHLRIVD